MKGNRSSECLHQLWPQRWISLFHIFQKRILGLPDRQFPIVALRPELPRCLAGAATPTFPRPLLFPSRISSSLLRLELRATWVPMAGSATKIDAASAEHQRGHTGPPLRKINSGNPCLAADRGKKFEQSSTQEVTNAAGIRRGKVGE